MRFFFFDFDNNVMQTYYLQLITILLMTIKIFFSFLLSFPTQFSSFNDFVVYKWKWKIGQIEQLRWLIIKW